MRYYKLIYDYEKDDNYVNCDVGHIGNMDEYITSNGKKIKEWNDVVFEYNSNEGDIFTDYLANLYRWIIVSSAFIELTQKVIENQVQYLPVKVMDKITKAETDSYFVANIVTTVDGLDMKKSKYDIFELDDEKIVSVKKYVLKKSEIADNHIFRLKSDTIPVFVSETIKRMIEDNNLSGFAFLEVDVSWLYVEEIRVEEILILQNNDLKIVFLHGFILESFIDVSTEQECWRLF